MIKMMVLFIIGILIIIPIENKFMIYLIINRMMIIIKMNMDFKIIFILNTMIKIMIFKRMMIINKNIKKEIFIKI